MRLHNKGLTLVLSLALGALATACGDAATAAKSDAMALPKDFAQGDAILSTDTESTPDEATLDSLPDIETPIEDIAPDLPQVPPDVAPELPPVDLAPDVPEDVASPLLCPGCDFSVQPPAPHPGGPGPLALADPYTVSYGAQYQKMAIIKPLSAGIFPVLMFVPGKQLATNGMGGTLGENYMDFLKHVASHGYIVAFVQVEMNAFDGDHMRMADDLLAAQKALPDLVSTADVSHIAYAGHSMGAKVVFEAAYKNINTDTANKIQDPAAVLMFALSNEPPPLGTFHDAQIEAKAMWAGADTYFTFVQAHDDTIAPYLDATKANGLTLYNELKTEHRQIIVLRGTGKGDPNPQTSPELADDHSAPLTIDGTKPGGVAGMAMPVSHLDALDWYAYWKLTVGALDFHFKKGDATWAYGPMRVHGGNLPQGGFVTHEVLAQGWK